MPLSNKTSNHKLYYLLGSKVEPCPHHTTTGEDRPIRNTKKNIYPSSGSQAGKWNSSDTYTEAWGLSKLAWGRVLDRWEEGGKAQVFQWSLVGLRCSACWTAFLGAGAAAAAYREGQPVLVTDKERSGGPGTGKYQELGVWR